MNDPALKAAGKKPGLEIFRIEKTKLLLVTDLTKFGKFPATGSYIVLFTDKTSTGWKFDIHSWHGINAQPDEIATTNAKTAELTECLDGVPIHHREIQGHESQQFQNLFKAFGGLRYTTDLGSKKAESDKKLFHVKGKRNIRVFQLPLSHESLIKNGVFILDTSAKIFQWNGEKSRRSEKAKALEVVKQIRDTEHGGKAAVAVIDEGKDDDAEFFQMLGGKGAIKEATTNEVQEVKKVTESRLYKITDASGPLKMEEVGSGVLKRDQLETTDAFVVDTSQQLFIWFGKKATRLDKIGAWNIAQKFMAEKGYPNWVPCTRVPEGAESGLFMQQFASWPKPELSPNFEKSTNIGKIVKKDLDLSKVQIQEKPEKQKYVDDGSGKVEVWKVEGYQKVMVSIREFGHFYQGDCYIVLYTYKDKYQRDNFIIYFWLGKDSTEEQKTNASLLALELDHEYSGVPVVVRVVQGREPDHFLCFFKGDFIAHQGNHPEGFRASIDGNSIVGTHMFQVRGNTTPNTKAIEVDAKASSLNSNECFVVVTDEFTHCWFGKYSTGDERGIAKKVADSLVRVATKVETVFEGSEPDAFWETVSGKGEYSNKQAESVPEIDPRLFQCSNASGNFTLEEIFDFTQDDLISEDVMLLDSWSEVYFWVGNTSSSAERNLALETLTKYLHYAPGGRSPEATPVLIVKQGFESPLFTCHFIWDEKRARGGIDSYETLKAQLVTKATQSSAPPPATAQKDLAKFSKVFPYEILLRRPLPEGVDSKNLENHLSPDDFKRVFGATEAEFRAWPTWKKEAKKKDAKLF